MLRRAIRKIFGGRHRRSRDPFLVTRRLVQAASPMIFDVGAHVGETAARYRALFPEASIHCFEPFPESFDRLSAAVRGDARTTAHRVAVADSTGTAKLRVNRASVTNSLLASDGRAAQYWGAGLLETETEVTVDTLTLDDFCRRHGIDRVDVLKIDVQGAEYAVLAGARTLLDRNAVDLLYLEMIMAPTYVGQRKYHDYLTSLDACGYVLFDLFNFTRRDGRLIQADGIFVSTTFLERYEAERQRDRAT